MAYSLIYSYDSSSQSYSVTYYSNITTSDEVVIRDTYNDETHGELPVTSIGNSAFIDCSSLTNITIPDSVTSIGDYAFLGCSRLTSVTIGNGLTSIGEFAFNNCSSLTMFDIPDSVTSIGNGAFSGCSSLTSVTIPNSVTSIGNSAFSGCSSLTNISVNENNQSYKSIDGNLYTKDGKTLIQYAIGKSAITFVIPDSVTSIGGDAFSGCSSLTSVTIPDSVTSIGDSAFSGCSSLTSITIPDNVTSIGSSAFYNCGNLKQLILFPSSPPTLGSNAIPATIQSIYVQQSSKAAYQTNWNGFGNKIVSDNIYLSFVRFNLKNKEYIDGKADSKLTAPTTPAADSAITMLADGTVGTKPLSEIGGGGTITVDTSLSSTSENPVQNKVINTALNNKQNKLTAGTGITISDSNVISSSVPTVTITGTSGSFTPYQTDVLDGNKDAYIILDNKNYYSYNYKDGIYINTSISNSYQSLVVGRIKWIKGNSTWSLEEFTYGLKQYKHMIKIDLDGSGEYVHYIKFDVYTTEDFAYDQYDQLGYILKNIVCPQSVTYVNTSNDGYGSLVIKDESPDDPNTYLFSIRGVIDEGGTVTTVNTGIDGSSLFYDVVVK